ncbi:MAG: hypothetical protein R2708_27810 [Vicinamibacterales bacterium]
MKLVGAYSPQGAPSWVTCGTIASFASDHELAAAAARSRATGFQWVLQVGFDVDPTRAAGPVAAAARARCEAAGLWPHVVAVIYGEEWLEKLHGGAFRGYGLPMGTDAEVLDSVNTVRRWMGEQHKAVRLATLKPVVWVTNRAETSMEAGVRAWRPIPDWTSAVALDAYVWDGQTFRDDVAPVLARAETTTDLPLVLIPQWFRGTGPQHRAWLTGPSASDVESYTAWFRRDRWVAMLGFLWASRPWQDLRGLEDMPDLRTAVERSLGWRDETTADGGCVRAAGGVGVRARPGAGPTRHRATGERGRPGPLRLRARRVARVQMRLDQGRRRGAPRDRREVGAQREARNPDDLSMDVVTFRLGPTDRHVQAFDVCGSCGAGRHRWCGTTSRTGRPSASQARRSGCALTARRTRRHRHRRRRRPTSRPCSTRWPRSRPRVAEVDAKADAASRESLNAALRALELLDAVRALPAAPPTAPPAPPPMLGRQSVRVGRRQDPPLPGATVMPLSLERLAPGDCLLYGGRGFFNRVIQVKTWSRYSHVEIYDGDGWSLASRNGIGVARYPVRTDDLLTVLRLRTPFEMAGIRAYFRESDGQGYDWWGLLAFTSARWQGRDNGKQFCSEAAARAYRRGIGAACAHPSAQQGHASALAALGLDPWNGYDADGLAPGEFPKSAAFRVEMER